MDVLADVLSITRTGATVVAQAELVPPWGLEIDPIAEAHIHVVVRKRKGKSTCEIREAMVKPRGRGWSTGVEDRRVRGGNRLEHEGFWART